MIGAWGGGGHDGRHGDEEEEDSLP
jgi:hypothetical protein